MSSVTNKNKKSKGRSVPSRFKQSAENYSSSYSSGISSDTVKGASVEQTICSKTSTPSQPATSRPAFNASAIPNASVYKPKKDKTTLVQAALTSTTYKKTSVKKPLNLTVHPGPVRSKNISDPVRSKNILDPVRSKNILDPVRSKNISDPTSECPEEELDALYADYQLSILLENRAKEGMLLKSKVALEKFYEAFYYLQHLIENQKNKEKELNFVDLHLKLHEHLQKQENMLTPFLKILPCFDKQYEEIAVATNCVKHKLSIQDVHLPDEGSEGEIIQLCESIGNSLEQILKVGGDIDSLVNSAETANTYISTAKLTVDEIERGYTLLSEIRNLTLSEASLKFASPL